MALMVCRIMLILMIRYISKRILMVHSEKCVYMTQRMDVLQ